MTIFEVKGVSFNHPGHSPSLREVSFSVKRGERIALLGANGSGKSTLLYLLDGLYFPTRGGIDAFGHPLTESGVEKDSLFRKKVGFLFQNSDAQLFCPTVEEEISFGPLQLGLGREEVRARLEDILRILGLHSLRHRYPQSLSGGEKKRVALASLLVMNPEVLLLDEPFSGLDPRSQRQLLELLEQLHERGTTQLISTHDLLTVSRLADRALVLGEDHRLATDASAEEVLSNQDLLRASNLI
jgi:cobalt/nickel transport system ATP-binding protein